MRASRASVARHFRLPRSSRSRASLAATRLVLNGAECEPWICCDDALMRERAEDVVLGAQLLLLALQAESARDRDRRRQAEPRSRRCRQHSIARGDDRLQLVIVPAIYPRGAERQLITAVTGAEVPTRALPAGDRLSRARMLRTAAAIAHWSRTGEPCISRIVTVTGNAVRTPVQRSSPHWHAAARASSRRRAVTTARHTG